MHTGKRGVGGAWVFLTHIMYIWTLRQKIRQTQAQTHIHTLTGRSFHTTVTHPLILLTLTDKYATTESHADTHTGLSDLASHAPVHREASQHLSLPYVLLMTLK